MSSTHASSATSGRPAIPFRAKSAAMPLVVILAVGGWYAVHATRLDASANPPPDAGSPIPSSWPERCSSPAPRTAAPARS